MTKWLILATVLLGGCGYVPKDKGQIMLEDAVSTCNEMQAWGQHANDDVATECNKVRIALVDYMLKKANGA